MRLVLAALATGTALALIAVACGTPEPTVTSSDGNGSNEAGLDGTWDLVSGMHDGTSLPMPAGATIDLTIDGSTAGGTAACNQWFGEVTIEGQDLSFSQLGQTEMACLDDRMDAEQAYLTALVAVTGHELAGDQLTLTGTGVELVFTRRPPVDDADLVGTTWILDTLIEGDAASSTAGDEASLLFSDDGTLSGSTGCRAFAGTWATDDGGQLVIRDVVGSDVECPVDLARQDQHVLETLAGRVVAEVDGNRLTISGPNNTGLGYTS